MQNFQVKSENVVLQLVPREALHKSFTVLQRGRANDNRREHCAKKKKTELTDCSQPTAASAMDLSRLPFLLVDLDDVRTTS